MIQVIVKRFIVFSQQAWSKYRIKQIRIVYIKSRIYYDLYNNKY